MTVLGNVDTEHLVLKESIVIQWLHLPLRLNVEDTDVAGRIAHKNDRAVLRAEHADAGH